MDDAGSVVPERVAAHDDILAADWLHRQDICVPSHITGQAVEAVEGAMPSIRSVRT